jgi:quinone-modifying oxidoreductase, subunit QmoC
VEADEKRNEDITTSPISEETRVISPNGKVVKITPDLEFIESLKNQVGNQFKICMQCGTCSATCDISPDKAAFPCKEMAWANWGMKDLLMGDPDVWLCHQCNDCSESCPRGARPGDVLSAIRRESIIENAFPRFMGRFVNRPSNVPLLFAFPAILLTLLLYVKGPIERALGLAEPAGERIIYSYSSEFPHWLLNSFFLLVTLFAFVALGVGAKRFWRSMKRFDKRNGVVTPIKTGFQSFIAAFKKIVLHQDLHTCKSMHSRSKTHMAVAFGFIALFATSLWVITIRINPIVSGPFIYPLNFWSPWKILANIGGLSLVVGSLWMWWDRIKDPANSPVNRYFDWSLLTMLILVGLSGFATELLHFVRLEPHRHLVYFIHLLLISTLFIYLPYSKFAHTIYRATAMIYAEKYGRLKELDNLPEKNVIVKEKVAEEVEVSA